MSSTTSKPLTTTSSSSPYNPTPYKPRHPSWPYNPSDFTRQDPASDSTFYAPPRFVTHIDDAAIASLRSYYDAALPSAGRILDFCSSWVSHYPPRIETAAAEGKLRVVGMGMNEAELARNKVLDGGRILKDLNAEPEIPAEVCHGKDGERAGEDEKLDAATCVVSIDYLVKPVEVLRSLRARMKPGGTVHLVVSNRCFPTKAISRWLRVTEEERLWMVGDYLHEAGWREIEILDLKAPDKEGGEEGEEKGQQKGFRDLMRMMGMGGGDPLWVVRGSAP